MLDIFFFLYKTPVSTEWYGLQWLLSVNLKGFLRTQNTNNFKVIKYYFADSIILSQKEKEKEKMEVILRQEGQRLRSWFLPYAVYLMNHNRRLFLKGLLFSMWEMLTTSTMQDME